MSDTKSSATDIIKMMFQKYPAVFTIMIILGGSAYFGLEYYKTTLEYSGESYLETSAFDSIADNNTYEAELENKIEDLENLVMGMQTEQEQKQMQGVFDEIKTTQQEYEQKLREKDTLYQTEIHRLEQEIKQIYLEQKASQQIPNQDLIKEHAQEFQNRIQELEMELERTKEECERNTDMIYREKEIIQDDMNAFHADSFENHSIDDFIEPEYKKPIIRR
ncbi:MAG: hypothetical protein U9Q15_02075 [Patescibacteria group bacterium]|nr:hypothetical protein [Patescibacteria group bacterium]